MNVTVSIGGSVLGADEPDQLRGYAAAVEAIHDAGADVSVVVGGGPVAREYIDSARACGANEMELDGLGIAATRLNARALISALGVESVTAPLETYEAAAERLRGGLIPVMGGVQAGQTTDAVAVALAEYTDADRLVLATSVPGVYDADPNADPDAERYERLSAGKLVDLIVTEQIDAGSSVPVDLLAAKLIERAGVETVVVDGHDPETVVDAAVNDRFDGTEIVAER
jgi:uridylate kinase